MNNIEFYINENGIACVPLKMYNDSLEEIERLNNELEKQNIDYGLEIERLNNIINELEERIVMKTNSDFIDTKVKDVCCELYQILQELKGGL